MSLAQSLETEYFILINCGLLDLRQDGINVLFCVPSTKIWFFFKHNKTDNLSARLRKIQNKK